jgi:hypothetical protein
VTAQQPGPRIVPPEEARAVIGSLAYTPEEGDALAHTAAVLGDRLAAIVNEHEAQDGVCLVDGEAHPCTTVRLATTGEDGKHFPEVTE